MDTGELVGTLIIALVYIALLVLSGFFMYWTAKILIVLPKCLLRITAALEKIANK